MAINNARRIDKSAYLILPVMALAFYIAFIPHQDYLYPLHIDEWLHIAYAESILASGSTTYLEPFYGELSLGISRSLEAGFHVFWGVFQRVSGISWNDIFRYFPGIILSITALSTYVLARREGFGWEAAFFACLIPTTVGILGPAFLVPVSLGLLFIPLSLFVAFNFRSVWSYLVLFIFTCFLLSIHAPSAIVLVIILFPYILLNLKSDFKHSLGIFLAVIIPFLAPFPWIFSMLLPTAKRLLTPQELPGYVSFPLVIKSYGYIPVALCILGTFLLAIRGGKKNYGLVFGLLALLVMLVTFYSFHYGISIMYERGLTFMILMVGIVAGAGLMGIKNLRFPENLTARLRVPIITQNIGKALCLVLIGITLAIAIPARQAIPYYHVIDEQDYKAFVWIKENLGEDYKKAILNPGKATAFTAITGKYLYTRTHNAPMAKDMEASQFLEEGCLDTDFLRENEISIIYTEGECSNPDLVKVIDRVYLLAETQ